MANTLFDRRANSVTRTVLLTENERNITPHVLAELLQLPATVGELLMRHDRVCFSVYGENLIAPILLKAFGAGGLLNLLEQKAIGFALQSSLITYSVSDILGLDPLQCGRLSSPVHSDPAESVADGLRRMTSKPDGDTFRQLHKALADSYVGGDLNLAPEAVTLAHHGYGQGRFAELGLPAEKELSKLDKADRNLLCRLATELHDLAFLSAFKMETLDELVITRVCDDSLAKITSTRKLVSAEARLFEIENVPSFAQMFNTGVLRVAEVPTMRQHPDALKFRTWIHEAANSADAADLARIYLDAVTHRNRPVNSTPAKITKTLGVSALSATIGALVAGSAGAAIGGTVGTLLPPTVDVTLDLIDQFVLGKVLEGWNPRNYFDKVVRPNLKKPSPGERRAG